MKVLITGAHGLVGMHLAKWFGRLNEVMALGRNELDITNAGQAFTLIQKQQPDLIINCAVLGVDECEADPAKAHSINVEGPLNLARAAAAIGSEIVHFSTNYVFDGKRESGFYTVDDKPQPINVYGKTKFKGEEAVKTACAQSYIIRTSWVFGAGKQSFFSTAHQSLAAGKAVQAITNMWASTTFVNDLVERVEEIAGRKYYGTYHVVNDGTCSYYEFAQEAARAVGLSEREASKLIIPIEAAEARPGTPRPRYTPMRCILSEEIGLAPMRDWRTALAEYIRGRM
jgi:dTDP-4-dehydrorhamnose reductase